MPRDPLDFDAQVVLANIRQAETDDLLDRVTAYRSSKEPEAVEMIEQELRDRGVTDERIADYAAWVRENVIVLADGLAATCSLCDAPAIAKGWGWYRLFRKVPIFPRRVFLC